MPSTKKTKKIPKTVKDLEILMSASSGPESESESEPDSKLRAKSDAKPKSKPKAKPEAKPKRKPKKEPEEVAKMRAELIDASRDGHVEKSVAAVKRMTASTVKKHYDEWTIERTRRANEFLTDLFISKFASSVGGLAAIEDIDEMEKELKRDQLLKSDLMSAVTWISPYIPFVGMLSSAATTAKCVVGLNTKDDQFIANNKDAEVVIQRDEQSIDIQNPE